MVKEFKDCIALAQYCLQVLGVEEDVTYHLSKWDPNNREKYIVSRKYGMRQKKISVRCSEELNIPFTEDVGEAAFYGPKVDINIRTYMAKKNNDHNSSGMHFLLNSSICTISTKTVTKNVRVSFIVHPWDAMKEHLHG